MAIAGLIHFKNGPMRGEFQGFITRIEDARYAITSNVRGRFPNPDFVDGVSYPNFALDRLSEAHLTRLRNMKRSWGDLTDLQVKEQHLERLERNYLYFHQLGIYGPLEPV